MDAKPVNEEQVVIVGAGPAGLAAANELVTRGVKPLVLEKSAKLGGIARTETYKGYSFDVGGHRFLTKNREINDLWHEILGENLLTVKRISRIYYQNRFFSYPLNFSNALYNLGLSQSLLILGSYVGSRIRPYPQDDTFEEWVSNRFGRRLYETFFKTYTEKVWGIPCHKIRADWAAQRIKGLSLLVAVSNALLGLQKAKSLVSEFLYPRMGPGMMWERFCERIEAGGGHVRLHCEVVRVEHEDGRVVGLSYADGHQTKRVRVSELVSSMALPRLIEMISPRLPGHVIQAAESLSYRSFALVGLILNRKELFSDQWIYVHNPDVKVGRIQNFKNWSAAMVPDPAKTSVGMEYFCTEGDDLWNLPDPELIRLASLELAKLGFCDPDEVMDGFVVRQPAAYPVYDEGYKANLRLIRQGLDRFTNLYTIGRNGMHRYNNIDHSMLTGILAAQNIQGSHHDLWTVNEEEGYLEEAPKREEGETTGLRVFEGTFARMDKLAFATAIGSVSGLIAFLATVWLVVKGGEIVGPRLILLAQYFIGFTVTLRGAFIAFAYSFGWGFLLGWLFAYLRNLSLGYLIYKGKKKAELFSFRDFIDGL
jgi:protoporphyrinogen oxidase